MHSYLAFGVASAPIGQCCHVGTGDSVFGPLVWLTAHDHIGARYEDSWSP
jgi:hypothetical protein